MGIITGGLGGTHLITQGYGYAPIVISVVEKGIIKPKIVYVDRKFEFKVEPLNVLSDSLSQELRLNSLSIINLKQLKKLCKRLNVVLPKQTIAIINDIIKIGYAKKTVDLSSLQIIKKATLDASIQNLSTILKNQKVSILSRLALIEQVKNNLPIDAKTTQKPEFKELLELLDKL